MTGISRRLARAALVLATLSLLAGCAQMMGGLRKDLDDSDPYDNQPPTVGGRWAGHGFLADDMPEGGGGDERAVGHSERYIASGSQTGGMAGRTWVTEDDMAANRRDARRGGTGEGGDDEVGTPSFSSAPDMAPASKRLYKNGARATRDDFIDQSQNEGSLWASDGQTNYYFTKNKIRGVGDIVNVTLEESTVKDLSLEARRTLSASEREYEILAAQDRIRAKALGLPTDDDKDKKDQLGSSSAAPARDPNKPPVNPDEVVIREATYADIDMTKSLQVKAGDQMLGEIVERYPNGNYKIRATKRIPYKGGNPRLVILTGVVRGSDIGEDDVVAAGKLYEYKLEAIR